MDELTALLTAASDGDRFALGAFIRRTQPEVWRLCAHLVDPDTADDLTQETYLRAWTALGRFRGDASARTWLLSIARRVCADAVGTQQRRRALRRLLDRQPHRPPVSDPAGGVALHALLGDLDPDRRAAFVLTRMLGLSYAEAAAVCGCPVGTIRSRVARARTDLIDRLQATTAAAGDRQR